MPYKRKRPRHPDRHNDKKQLLCDSERKNGGPCRKPVVKGRKQCRHHGGNALRGEEHPNYKDGRYAQYVPARVEATDENPDEYHVSVAEDIDLVDVRLSELVSRAALLQDADDRAEEYRIWREVRLLLKTKTLLIADKQRLQIQAEELRALRAGSLFSGVNLDLSKFQDS